MPEHDHANCADCMNADAEDERQRELGYEDGRCDLCVALGSAWCNECALNVAASTSASRRKQSS